MSQIRPKQIRLNAEGDIIIGNATLSGSIVTKGTDRTVLMAGTSTLGYEFVSELRDSLGNALLSAIDSPGLVNTITITGGTAGNGPEFSVVGEANADLLLTPNGTGDVIVPTGYTPNTDFSLVNKAYADAVATGLDFKNSVRVATNASSEVSSFTYTAGTDEWTVVITPTFDSIALANGDRVLIKDSTDQRGNGIWDFDSGLSKFTRSIDADNSPQNEVSGGMFVFTEEGTVNSDTGWVMTDPNGNAALGTDNLVFVQFSSAGSFSVAGGNGIISSPSGSVFTVTADVDNSTIRNTGGTGDQIAVFDGLVNQTLLGQGAATDAAWGYTSSLFDSNGVLILEGTNSTTPVNYLNVESSDTTVGVKIAPKGTDINIDLVIESKGATGRISLDGVLWPKGPIPQASIISAVATDDLQPISPALTGTGDQILLFNDTTNQLEWVITSTIGGNAWGDIALTGNTAGDLTISPNATNTTLTLNGGEGIEITGTNATDIVSIGLGINTLAVSVTVDGAVDSIVFYDNSTGTHQQITLDNLTSEIVRDAYDDVVASGGANESFLGFFTSTPVDDLSITIYFNGIALRAGGTAGWTRSGTTLVLVDAVNGYAAEAGDIISATYRF